MSSTPPGTFFGAVRHHRATPQWIVTDLHHPRPNQFPSHAHRWACLTILLSGEYAEHDGSRWREREVNTVVVRPELAPHADRIGGRGARFLTVEVSPDLLPALSDQTAPLGDWIISRNPVLTVLGWKLNEAVRLDSGDAAVLEGYLHALVAELAPELHRSRRPPAWLARVLAMLHDQPDARVTIVELAREAGVHPAHLTRAFRRHLGHTIGTYQRNLRLGTAMRRLEGRSDSPARVAAEAGFYDQAHLSRTFRKVTGLTPGQYREFARSST